MKRVRRKQVVENVNKPEVQFERLHGICVYKDEVYVISKENIHSVTITNVHNEHKVIVPINKITCVPENTFLYKTYEFLFYRKWYVTNFYDNNYKNEVLFELNLYLKQTEKFLIKKYKK